MKMVFQKADGNDLVQTSFLIKFNYFRKYLKIINF